MDRKLLNRREAEQYVFELTGMNVAALGGLAEEKYTKHELNQLIIELVKHNEENNE